LSVGELIDFFLAAWPLQEVLEMNELDRDGAQDFTRPSSEVYPQFAAGIRARVDGWYAENPAFESPAMLPITLNLLQQPA
jgi:hypothetical protein